MARTVGLGDLDLHPLRRHQDEGVVGAEIGDFLDTSGKQVGANPVGPLLADADLLGPHRHRHRHVDRTTDAVADLDLADLGVHGAAVRLVDAQLAIEQVHVADEVGHETVGRVFVDFLGRAHLQHTALAHDGDAAGHGHGLFLVVGHHHHGHAHLLDDVDQLELGLLAQFLVQRAQRLVQQQQLGLLGQAARQRHALLLAARELVRLALGIGCELHQGEHLVGALLDLGLGQALALQTEGHVLPDVQVREQRIALEHHVDRPLVRRQSGDVLTTQKDATLGRCLETRQHAQQGRLATAGRTQQGKDLAFADRQRHLVDSHGFIEALDQLLGDQIPLLCARLGHAISPVIRTSETKRAVQTRRLNSPWSDVLAASGRLTCPS